MPTIALIGLRGAGKTAVGKELAKRLRGRFIDTDDLAVQAAGKSIAAIFADEGEAEFRRLEREAVRRAVADRPDVLSVGGGAILDPQNEAAIRAMATIVWLTAPPEILLARVQADAKSAATRPSLTASAPLEEMRQLLRDRSSIYQRLADHVIDTSAFGIEDVAHRIMKLTGEGERKS